VTTNKQHWVIDVLADLTSTLDADRHEVARHHLFYAMHAIAAVEGSASTQSKLCAVPKFEQKRLH